jgi:hypothetical protein
MVKKEQGKRSQKSNRSRDNQHQNRKRWQLASESFSKLTTQRPEN